MDKSLRNAYLVNVLALVGVGVVMVFSSSAISVLPGSEVDPFIFIKRHLIFLGLGLGAMTVIARMDYHTLARLAKPLYLLGLVLLILTLVPGIGTKYNGASRWIRFGGVGIQPSDYAKFALIIGAAAFGAARRSEIGTFARGFVPACLFIGAYSVVTMAQPDLGTSLFLGLTGFLVLLAAGLSPRHLAIVALLLLPLAAGVMFVKFDHVKERVFTFLNPESDPLGKGHQVKQSMIAIGSGGFEGEGLGQSTQKLYYLPEQETDFIFAVLAEETGFIGASFTLLLFGSLMLLGWRVSARAPDPLGSLLALGVTASIGIQACMNIAVVTASVPTKGIGLPFVSFGGSGAFFYLCSVGVALSVARQAVSPQRAQQLMQEEARAMRIESMRQSARLKPQAA
ncbi:MAG: putative lipid II flippase FtsW [Planctomycetes bacterium]|nr:putative lipid II flippase FtsW [Planctomycetota bacterium]